VLSRSDQELREGAKLLVTKKIDDEQYMAVEYKVPNKTRHPNLLHGIVVSVVNEALPKPSNSLFGFGVIKVTYILDKEGVYLIREDVTLQVISLRSGFAEARFFLSPTQTDGDEDGFSDLKELLDGTDPLKSDTDGDLWPDPWDTNPREYWLPNGFFPIAAVLVARWAWGWLRSRKRQPDELEVAYLKIGEEKGYRY